MTDARVLIVDDDADAAAALAVAFQGAGLAAESVAGTFAAIEKLSERTYHAVILDPVIRRCFNGFMVLSFLEQERPELLDRLFLWTGMSELMIRRTAPELVTRLFRKQSEAAEIVAAVMQTRTDTTASSTSVLVVEDDRATAQATMQMLQELGYSAHWAHNGQEALEMLRGRAFAAILLDLVMPHVDGFTLLERFQADDPMLLRRVIVMTGMPERYTGALEAYALGGTVAKPLDLDRLTRLLEAAASGGLQ